MNTTYNHKERNGTNGIRNGNTLLEGTEHGMIGNPHLMVEKTPSLETYVRTSLPRSISPLMTT